MTCLSREAILAAEAIKPIRIEVPEWGGYVFITRVSAADWMGIQDSLINEERSNAIWTGKVLSLSIVDENGNRLFTENDIPSLMSKSLSAVNRLFRAADSINDFTGKGLKEAEKNSDEGAGGDSPSPSPEN